MPTTVKKRSVVVSGHRTSISLERAFWEALREIAAQRDVTINQLVSEIDAARSGNLSSAIRVFILNHVMAVAEALREGERPAGERGAEERAGAAAAAAQRGENRAHD